MSEVNKKILDMILKNASANEIATATGLSNKQLFYRLNMLKNKGYNFSKKYYQDGEIVYKLDKGIEQTEKDTYLLTSPNTKGITIVFISDLHLANKKDRVDLLKQVYEFCSKEGIHIIINGGDVIDGYVGNYDYKRFTTAEEQIEYALKYYPYDKNILNFTCLGNHDYSILAKTGENLETILEAKRHDIISLGYGMGRLKIKNDEIIVRHPHTPTTDPVHDIKTGLLLTGHGHKTRNVVNGHLINLYLSSLSDIKIADYSLPGFIKATISFSHGVFSHGIFEQYIFFDKMYKVSEFNYELAHGKNENEQVIKYEEDRIPYSEEKILKDEEPSVEPEVETLKQVAPRLSQTEKFNQRFSRYLKK